MTRITVDVNDEWLEDARDVLGTDTKVGTINAALHSFALRKQATAIVEALDSVQMDFADSDRAWRYGGGETSPDSLKMREALTATDGGAHLPR